MRHIYVDDTSIAHFMTRLKGLALDSNVRGIGTKPVTDWLKRLPAHSRDFSRELAGKII